MSVDLGTYTDNLGEDYVVVGNAYCKDLRENMVIYYKVTNPRAWLSMEEERWFEILDTEKDIRKFTPKNSKSLQYKDSYSDFLDVLSEHTR